MLFDNPLDLLFRIPALLLALTFHEYAHARMAYAWGDPTAKNAGRLTLNPISHLDPLGTIMMLLVRFGWAKPVPINPMNFRDQRGGLFWVSLAGPGINLVIGLVATFLFFYFQGLGPVFRSLMSNIIILNIFLAVFNMIPLPPLDGSKILASMLPTPYLRVYYSIEPYAPVLLIMMLVFGLHRVFLIPIAYFIIDLFSTMARFLVF